MPKGRRKIEARVVPLTSRAAGEARVGGTVAERVALVAELSEMLWAHTGRPHASYTRATMPVSITTLYAQSARD